MKCVGCGFEAAPDFAFCPKCGSKLPAACPSCGAACSTDFSFCPRCGARLTEAPAAPAELPSPEVKPTLAREVVSPDLDEKTRAPEDLAETDRRPVTVLFGLEKTRVRNALGVQVAADWDRFDIDKPLAGRWVRFWQTPYSGAQNGTEFKDRLESNPENQRAIDQDNRERLRLLYVGWTRARDRLVLAAHEGKLLNGILRGVTDVRLNRP